MVRGTGSLPILSRCDVNNVKCVEELCIFTCGLQSQAGANNLNAFHRVQNR